MIHITWVLPGLLLGAKNIKIVPKNLVKNVKKDTEKVAMCISKII